MVVRAVVTIEAAARVAAVRVIAEGRVAKAARAEVTVIVVLRVKVMAEARVVDKAVARVTAVIRVMVEAIRAKAEVRVRASAKEAAKEAVREAVGVLRVILTSINTSISIVMAKAVVRVRAGKAVNHVICRERHNQQPHRSRLKERRRVFISKMNKKTAAISAAVFCCVTKSF